MALLDPDEISLSSECYAACPNCSGPVNISYEVARAIADFIAVLGEVVPEATPAEIEDVLTWTAVECNEQWIDQLRRMTRYLHVDRLREALDEQRRARVRKTAREKSRKSRRGKR